MAMVWEKWRIIYPFWLVVISLSMIQKCQGATHWIVTENGRIEAQTNSLFNLQKPFDLVTFIHQEQELNKVYLRGELKKEQDILDEVNRQEKIDLSETFFKTDPTCSRLKRWYELDLSLNFIIPFSSKDINVGQHIDLESAVKTHSVKTPLCLQNIPITLYSYDHLEGVANRHTLPGISEHGLLTTMKYVTDVDDWGDRIARALNKNSTSWVLQNMAALYWRIKGNTAQSVNCLREALYYSPRQHQDIALFSLAVVLHHANYSLDAIMLLHVSLEITRDVAIHQYVLGNIYATLQLFNMTELCLKYVTLVQPAFQHAVNKLKVAVCERRYHEAVLDQFSSLEKVLSKVQKHKDKHQSLQKLQDRDNIKQQFAYDVFKRQIERFSREPVAQSESPLSANQEVISNEKSKGQDMTNIQKDIVSAIGNNNIDNGEAFTVNIQLDQGGPVVQKKVFCQKANADGKTTQVPCQIFEVAGKQGETNTQLHINDEKETTKSEKMESGRKVDGRESENKKKEQKKAATNSVKESNKQLKSGGMEMKKVKKEKPKDSPKEKQNKNNFSKSVKVEKRGSDVKVSDAVKDGKLSSKTAENTAKTRKPKKKHETERRTATPHKDENMSLQEKTLRQVEHARATIARVKSMLLVPQAAVESNVPFRGAKNTAGPGGTGQGVFLKDDLKSTKKGESVRSASDDPTFERSQAPPIKHYQPDKQQKQFCENPSDNSNKKRKGDTLGRGCHTPSKNGPQKQSKKVVSSEKIQKNSENGKQSRPHASKTSQIPEKSHGNNKVKKCPQSTEGHVEYNTKSTEATKHGNDGKEKVLLSLKEFQEVLKKSKKQPGHNFDHRKCDDIDDPMGQLSHKATKFSTVVSVISKGVEVSRYIDFNENISGLPKPPRCLAKIIPGRSLGDIKGILQVGKSPVQPESSLKQTLLSHAHLVGKNIGLEEMGTRINRALKRNPTSYVLLNIASLYWRVTGEAYEAVRCLRLAVQHAPTKAALDIPLISLQSILYRAGFLQDAATIGKEALEISPNAAIAHFALANTLAAQGNITQATQHFLIVLQLEPGFAPAIERLKVIQCILWNEQKKLEKEADELRKLLANS